MVARALLLLLLAVVVASDPSSILLPDINAVYPVGAGADSNPFVAALGPAPSLAACISTAIVWRNTTSASAVRCRAASWLRAPSNTSLTGDCFCRIDVRWLAVPSPGVDSARLIWPCASASDCSFNGECDADSACACDVGWSGPFCGELRLLPVDAAAQGLRFVNNAGENVSTWGAPMLRDESTGLWHAWPSEMVNDCGINSWTTNSHIVHATALTPGGPWLRQEEVVPVFAHEPNVVRGPSGEWVMVYSGYMLPEPSSSRCTNCANGVTLNHSSHNGCGPNASHGFKKLLSVATSPNGPWGTPIDITKLDEPWDWNLAIAILPNGTAIGLLRACFVWRATKYDDVVTWQPVGGSPQGPPLPDSNVEDPFVWLDKRGIFHSVMHAMEVAEMGGAFCGGHAFSQDGLTWVNTGFAYSNVVNFTDGSVQSFSRRERPHILFAADGSTPIALSNGVEYGNNDAIFSLVQPIFH